uniref:Uncharacterized protein n=1 Tax=viral metagenome TaxID=1070528 RepID=A0A6C0J084_9ZZZZ
MSKNVVKTAAFDLAQVGLACPEKIKDKFRFSKADVPLVQTCEMTYSYEGETMEILCTPEYADFVHQMDHALCTAISDNSEAWFDKNITYEQLERMYRPTLQGGRNPRQKLKASSFKAFDIETKLIDTFPSLGSGIFIFKLDGVKFEEKVCEAQWSVVQAKKCLPPAPPAPVVSPMFV